MKSCRITFGETKLLVSSDHEGFLAFVKKYFTGHYCLSEDISLEDNQLAVSFSERGGWSPRGRRIERERVVTWLGEGLGLTKEGNFLFEDKEITGEIIWDSRVRAQIEFRPILLKSIANYLIPNPISLRERYFRLVVRGVIQQILFMLEAQGRGVEILSAASLLFQGKAYVFAGLPGSGKTTTVSHLAKTLPGAIILAQNYTPVHVDTTWAFTEGLTVNVEGKFPIGGVFIVTHGKEFNHQLIDQATALASLTFINHATAELPVHSRLGALLLGKTSASSLTSMPYIEELVKNVPVQMVVMDNCLPAFTDFFVKNYGASS